MATHTEGGAAAQAMAIVHKILNVVPFSALLDPDDSHAHDSLLDPAFTKCALCLSWSRRNACCCSRCAFIMLYTRLAF